MPAFCLAAFALAACGSASAPGDVVDPAPNFDAFDKLNEAVEILPLATNMPGSGAAQYDGLARIDYSAGDGTEAMVGTARIDVDFSSLGVNGSLSDFVHETRGKVGGTVQLEGGTITGPLISGLEIAGDLWIDGSPTAFQGAGRGQFRGENAEALRLDLFGEGNTPGRPAGWSGAVYGILP